MRIRMRMDMIKSEFWIWISSMKNEGRGIEGLKAVNVFSREV